MCGRRRTESTVGTHCRSTDDDSIAQAKECTDQGIRVENSLQKKYDRIAWIITRCACSTLHAKLLSSTGLMPPAAAGRGASRAASGEKRQKVVGIDKDSITSLKV